MNKFVVTCSCGMQIFSDKANKQEAIADIKTKMTMEEVKKHFAMEPKHKGEQMPSMDMVNMMIEQGIAPVVAG